MAVLPICIGMILMRLHKWLSHLSAPYMYRDDSFNPDYVIENETCSLYV